MPDRKLLLDLDRTLFNTPLFIRTLWDWIEKTYGVDAATSRKNMKSYFRYVGDMYDYDFFRHIAELGINTDDVVRRALHDFKAEVFIYSDVAAFLKNTMDIDRAILTFGNDDYQQFKLSFCPELAGMSVHTTRSYKSEYIKKYWPSTPTILVDDKLLVGTLPNNTNFIHIDRVQTRPVIEHDTYVSVHSLADIKQEWLL